MSSSRVRPVEARVVIGPGLYGRLTARSSRRDRRGAPGGGLTRGRARSYSRLMPLRIVWYPDGSPVAQLAAALPAPFEGHPLSEAPTLRSRAGDPEILVLDTDHDPLDAARVLGERANSVLVVGLVSPQDDGPRWPMSWYAYLPRPGTPGGLAKTLENA